MKVYKAWSDSNHKLVYILGYFKNKKDAWTVLNSYRQDCDCIGASDPEYGVEEIEIIESIDIPSTT